MQIDKLKTIYTAQGLQILGTALCSPDFESGQIVIDPWQKEDKRTILWPVYLRECVCDIDVFVETNEPRVFGHYTYCLESMPDPYTNNDQLLKLFDLFKYIEIEQNELPMDNTWVVNYKANVLDNVSGCVISKISREDAIITAAWEIYNG